MTDKNMEYLESCEILSGDGTFSTVPNMFSQLYTIHGTQANKPSFPLIYVSMKDRLKETYDEVLRKKKIEA